MIEPLEPRRLFSGSVDFKNGLLTVVGTDGADHVAFAVDPQFIRVTLNGVVTKLDADRVRSIQINTNGGNDEIILGRKLDHRGADLRRLGQRHGQWRRGGRYDLRRRGK